MVRVTVHPSFGYDLSQFDLWNLNYGISATRTASTFTVHYGNGARDVFQGSGFRYDARGMPNAGSVHSFSA